MIERKNLLLALCMLCTALLCPNSHAQKLTLPDAAPVASAPALDGGAWVYYQDGSAALVELLDGSVHVALKTTENPGIIRAEWKDAKGVTWKVEVDCHGMTLVECSKKFEELYAFVESKHPAVPQ